MVIYEGLGHSQPTTASRMIQKVSKNRAVALLPRFRPILRWFPPKFPNRKNEWNFGVHCRSRPVWWSYTVLYGLGRPDAFLECSGGVKRASSLILWKLPIRYSQMFLQFRTLRCSRISQKKKTNRWNWIFLNVLERSRLDPNDAFGMKEIHRHMLRRLSEENFNCSLPPPDIQL